MKAQKQINAGFTIVELLIVIVVIGILAAITIVAFNGVQSRAKDASVQQALSTITKKAKAYQTITGSFPTLDEIRYNRAPGSTVNGSGPSEAKLEGGVTVGSEFATAETGTSYVRYVYISCGAANLDWWDYTNNRRTTLSTTPASHRIGDC